MSFETSENSDDRRLSPMPILRKRAWTAHYEK